MSSFSKHAKRDKVKWIVTFTLITFLCIALIFAFVRIDRNEKTKTIGADIFTYSIGILDESGEYEQGTSSIYTNDFYSVDGLTIEIKDKATITYQLFFFDAEKEFISSSSEGLSLNFDSSTIPENAEFFKVVITPTNDAEVSWTEIGTYAGQLTVTVNK